MLKALMRRWAPGWVWRRLRTWRMRRMLSSFTPYLVEHNYGRVRLQVSIADPLARGWYDRDWPPLPEVEYLRAGGVARGGTVFDVGAHQGVVAMMLADVVGPSGRVVAVEALPHNARVCGANRELNGLGQVCVEAAAIADRPGEVSIGVDLNAQVEHGGTTIGSARVPAVTVDGLAERYGHPDVLFLDVEGYECHALRGAMRTLEKSSTCFIEVHQGAGLEALGGSVPELLEVLLRHGYGLWTRAEEDAEFAPLADPESPPAGRFFLLAVPAGRPAPRAGACEDSCRLATGVAGP